MSVIRQTQHGIRQIVIIAVKGYQKLVSPWFGNRCRFHPSCSQYCIEALEQRGVTKGLMLACWRLLRCQPFNAGGFDPVPPKPNNKENN